MIALTIDYSFRLGDLLAGATLAFLTFALKQIYDVLREFLDRLRTGEDQLSRTSMMVDKHSRVLLKRGMLAGPIEQVHRRRKDDPHYLDEEAV